jgi:hypothetical protein
MLLNGQETNWRVDIQAKKAERRTRKGKKQGWRAHLNEEGGIYQAIYNPYGYILYI